MKKTSTYQHLFAFIFTLFLVISAGNVDAQINPVSNNINPKLVTGSIPNSNGGAFRTDSVCNVHVIVQTIDVLCHGGATGIAAAVAKGGDGTYSFVWSSGQTTEIILNLTAGNYTVTVTDAVGCADTMTIVINEPPPLVINTPIASTPASCSNVCNGTATVSASGGTGSIHYQWSANNQKGSTATGLCAGKYYVTATDDNGCKVVDSVTVAENSTLAVNISPEDVSCFGGNDGKITANGKGGTPPYSYTWSANAGSQTGNMATGLSSGSYSVTVTDVIGCFVVESAISVNQPSELTINLSSTDVNCFGASDGTASVSATGGTPPYSYLWSNGQMTSSIGSLSAGTYSVTVTDDNDCEKTGSVVINENPDLSISLVPTDATCNGLGDGMIDVTISGGAGPYMIDVSGNVNVSGGPVPGPNFTISNMGLTAGSYTVKVTDMNGCMETGQVSIGQPTPVDAMLTAVNVSCNGANDAEVTLTVTGGSGSGYRFRYRYNNGPKSPVFNYNSPITATNLAPGTYSVSAADGNYVLGKQGCFDIVSIVVTEPSPLVGNISGNRVSCFGAMDGSVSYSLSGGTPPYTYLWNTGATTSSLSGLSAGVYSITATDDNGCTTAASYTVEESPELLINIIAKNISCFGANDGLLSVTASGGDAPYTYLWNTGATTPSIPNPQAGNYSVTVTDAENCTKSASVTITEPSPFSVAAKPTDATCSNLCDGSAVATATGGSLPYTYLWSNGFTGPNPTGLCAGPYSVTITDNNGCSDTAMLVINEPAKIKLGLSTQNVTCPDDCDGSATITASGGTGNISYMWSTGATTPSISGLCAGKYVISVTDDNQCSEKISISILAPPPIVITVNTKDVTCNGGNDGEASVSVSGGKAPYKYIWSNFGSTGNTNINLTAGNYGIKVIDANGCSDSIGFVITEPSPIVINTTKMDANCFGVCDGSAMASPSGGKPPYTFSWSNGSTSPSATGLCAGTYTVTVTDQSLCTATASVQIGEPTAIVLTTSKINVTCNGAADGSATVNASGGTPVYSYSWSNGDTSSQILNLTPGTYTVTVTDMNGCTAMALVSIVEPTPLVVSTSSTPVSCNGGSDGTATTSVSGGNGPGYTYLWSDGQTTAIAVGLAAGTYMVTVTDQGAPNATGGTTFCTATDTIEVLEPTQVQVSLTMTPVSCNGGNDGTATASGSGGTPPYSYLWNTSASSASINSLVAGTYSVTITDANNCTASGSIVVTEPPVLSLTMSSTPVSCNGGSDGTATVSASGGTPGYSFIWNNGQTTPTATGLSAGVYSVTVTDANQCQMVDNVIVGQPTPIVLSTSKTNVSCNGGNDGSATVNASGGTPPYSYLWSDGQTTSTATGLMAGTYTVTVVDDNGCDETAVVMITEPTPLNVLLLKTDVSCFGGSDGTASANAGGGTPPYSYNWSNGSTSGVITGVAAGIYTVTVTDNKGCELVDSIEVLQPPSLLVNITVNQNVSCNGGNDGSATAVPGGGTPPYFYNWSNGGVLATQSTLSAGTYTVTVTDDNQCTVMGSVTITEPDPLVLTPSKTDVSCNGGSDGTATVAASGGTSPYTYSWSTGATTPMINSLKAGSYTVTVTDANNCTASVKVTVDEPTPLTCLLKGNEPSCFGAMDGSVSVVASGGTPFAPPISPYSYIWQDGTIGQVISGVGAGTYYVTVTDANGCTKVDSFTIGQPDPLKISISSNDESCPGENDGDATVTPSGGTPPYTYMWSNGATTATVSGLAPGTYSVTLTDDNGCTASINVLINAKPKTVYTLDVTNISCVTTGNTGSASISGLGNKGPYSFLWSTGATSAAVSNLSVGQYSVTITDGNGCKTDTSFSISAPDAILLSISGTPVSCNGASDGTATVVASGGVAPYTYSWDAGTGDQTSATATGLSGGNYSVTVMDDQGCVETEMITIFEPTPVIVIVNPASLNCFGDCDGTISANASGGTPGYTYQWSVNTGSQTGASATGLCAGIYSVTITDANGCSTSATTTLAQPPMLSATLTGDTSVSCNDSCDATLTLNTSGGTGPYTYECYLNSALVLSGSFGSTVSKSDLCAGSYMVVVTDLNGCTDTVMATITSPDPLTATANNDTVCANTCTGELTVTAGGGTPPYSYMWSNQQTTPTATGLCAGTYTVTVTDANGCTMTASGTVMMNPSIVLTKMTKQPVCFGQKNGRIIVKASGGSGNYTYQWNDVNNTMNDTLDGIGQNVNYCVTVTDDLGCTATICHSFHNPKELVLNIATTDASCGMSNGNAVVSVLGNPSGVGLTFQWNNGDMDAFNLGIPAGFYSVTVTDLNGCQATDTATVNDNCPKPASFIGYSNKLENTEFNITAFPNPFHSMANIVIEDAIDSFVEVELYDLDGRLILNVFEGKMENGSLHLEIDGSHLTSGIYLLKAMNSEGESTMLKLVLSR